MSEADVDRVRAANWNGAIPVVVTLASTSLSSPTVPPPMHAMVSRCTYLHVGLRDVVQRLHKFAPPTFAFGQKVVVEEPEVGPDAQDTDANTTKLPEQGPYADYPVCWFEDEATGLALRWHIPTGVLFDGSTASRASLPWKIRLHFTGYPNNQILALESGDDAGVWVTMERTFKNSLKQALYLQHGSAKVANNMSKQAHGQIWESLVHAKYPLYKQVCRNMELEAKPKSFQLLPVRLLVDSKPSMQKRCPYDADLTLFSLLHKWIPDIFGEESSATMDLADPRVRVAGVCPSLSAKIFDLWRGLSHPDFFLYIIINTVTSYFS